MERDEPFVDLLRNSRYGVKGESFCEQEAMGISVENNS